MRPKTAAEKNTLFGFLRISLLFLLLGTAAWGVYQPLLPSEKENNAREIQRAPLNSGVKQKIFAPTQAPTTAPTAISTATAFPTVIPSPTSTQSPTSTPAPKSTPAPTKTPIQRPTVVIPVVALPEEIASSEKKTPSKSEIACSYVKVITSQPADIFLISKGNKLFWGVANKWLIMPTESNIELVVQKEGFHDQVINVSPLSNGMHKTYNCPLIPLIQPLHDRAWTNSLGMSFIPNPNIPGLFGQYEVRNQDYRSIYPQHDSGDWVGLSLNKDNQPVVMVSKEDAVAFCQKLTNKEINEGFLPSNASYRLLTDHEWSVISEAHVDSSLPLSIAMNNANYFDKSADVRVGNGYIGNDYDGYPVTTPVGSFQANKQGFYDLRGNVWEWCMDASTNNSEYGILRGASFSENDADRINLQYRLENPISYCAHDAGFRMKLVVQ